MFANKRRRKIRGEGSWLTQIYLENGRENSVRARARYDCH